MRHCLLRFPEATPKYVTAFCAAISHCGHQQFLSRLAANFLSNKFVSLDKPSVVETNFLRFLWIFLVCATCLQSFAFQYLSVCAWVATSIILFCGSVVSCRRTSIEHAPLQTATVNERNRVLFF